MDTFFANKKRWTTFDVACLLVSNNALTAVTLQAATEFVSRMTPRRVKEGTVIFREGDTDPNFMVFIVQGEAVVESATDGHGEPVMLKLLGSGDIVGELGLIDNKARSATVTAVSELALAVMERAAFARMVREAPAEACSLLGALLQSVAGRLRESNRKVRMLSQINTSLHEELQTLHEQHTCESSCHPVEPAGTAFADSAFFASSPPAHALPQHKSRADAVPSAVSSGMLYGQLQADEEDGEQAARAARHAKPAIDSIASSARKSPFEQTCPM